MRKNIRRVLLLVFLAGALFTGWKYCEETAPDMASEKWYEAARQAGSAENTETAGGQGPWEPLPDFDALRASCPDIQAWIRNPGTQLDYPVVQAVFQGVRPAVAALILYSLVKLGRSARVLEHLDWLVSLLSFAAMAFLDLHPIVVVVCAALYGLLGRGAVVRALEARKGGRGAE